MNAPRKLSMQEKIAAAVSGAILVAIAIYWVTQVIGVVEMLKLAYG